MIRKLDIVEFLVVAGITFVTHMAVTAIWGLAARGTATVSIAGAVTTAVAIGLLVRASHRRNSRA